MNSKISSAFTTVEDVKIHYLSAGKGPTILFIHGWPTSSYLYRHIIEKVSEKYQVVAIDLPGFGKSDKRLKDSYSFRYHSRILNGFLDNLGLQKITLGVHDLGGPLGLYWMTHHMARVERLILFNTLIYPKFSFAVKLFAFATVAPGIRTVLSSPWGIRRSMLFGVTKKSNLTTAIIQHYQAPFHEKNARKVLLKSIHRLSMKVFEEISQALPSFKGPVQILYGEKDRILPDVAKTMKKVTEDLPQSRVQKFSDAGHFLQEEVSDELSLAILKFMNET